MSQLRARLGALEFWDELPRDARWLLSTVVVQFFGRGLTLPFMIIYLHEVRDFSLGTSGTLMGLIAVMGLVVVGPAGSLVDRYGARIVVVIGLLCGMAGLALLAFATTPLVAAVALCLFGIQLGASWPAVNALVSAVVTGDLRQRYFGVNFALLNLGIGVGGIVGGFSVDVDRPGTFMVAFLANAVAYVPALVVQLGPLRHVHGRAAQSADTSDDGAAPRRAGYLAIVRRREVQALLVVSALASFVGYGQIEGGFPAFARQEAQVSTQVIGFAFVVNTAVIVVMQFWTMKRARGRRRTRVLVAMAAVWAGAWLLFGATGLVPGTSAAIVGVLAFQGLFAVGETILHSAMPAVLNDMAPDHLRGRYNAAYSAAFQVGNITGPIAAGFLLQHHLSGGFIAVVVLGCAGVVVALLAMERRISPQVNGVEIPAADRDVEGVKAA